MNSDEYPIKEIKIGATVFSGFAFKSQDFSVEGIPVVKIKNVNNRIVNLTETQYFPEEKVSSKHNNFFLKDKDILIAMTGQGSVGRVGRISLKKGQKVLVNQRVGKFVTDEKNINQDYLFYVLSSPMYEQILFDTGTGSGQPNLSPKLILQTQIPLPSYQTQQKIGKILSVIDHKIQLNQQINQTLEAMGQAIFKHWFVDFEFPDENGNPYKSCGEKMVDSELGEIPIGWSIESLPQVSKIVDCLHTKKPDFIDSDKILLQVYNITEDGTLNFDKIYTVSESDYTEWTKNILLKKGDCLITNAGRVGAIGQVPLGFEGGIGRNITAIRPEKISPTYLIRYLFSKYGQDQILRLTDQGTILNSLNVKGIKKIKILIPSENVLIAFDNIARPLRAKVEKNTLENIYLAKIRDVLLPKLMSGKIRVII